MLKKMSNDVYKLTLKDDTYLGAAKRFVAIIYLCHKEIDKILD